MKTTFSQQRWRGKNLWAGAAVLGLGLANAPAQLAITEVMSHAAITHGTNLVGRGSDFWELTNFGTNSIDLTGYEFRDKAADTPRDNKGSFNALVIAPGESVIFFRTNATSRTINEQQFRAWWGPCLRQEVKVRSYLDPGLNNINDCVWLLDAQGHVVDHVCFGLARQGVSFVYDTNCGDLTAYSVPDVCGACVAADADDVASPGTTCGEVPLHIASQPASIDRLCAGLDAVFSVGACGMPRPKYQWLTNDTEIPDANEATLIIADAQPVNEGQYRVVIANGLKTVFSAPANLTVDTAPSSPRLLTCLADLERFVGEKAVFTAQVCAFPRPQFQWHSNGVPIGGATTRTLVLPDLTRPMTGIVFRLNITNDNGWTNVSASLSVYPRPQLEITEVMPAPDTNGACALHANWFELTNRGTNGVKLRMLQHSDQYSPVGAQAVTNRGELLPGESAIFVEGMSREEFVHWWGETNLPPQLKVITYVGYGLSPWFDNVYVRSAADESQDAPALAGVGWASPTPSWVPPTCPCSCDPDLCGHPLYGHSLFFVLDDNCAFDGRVCRENENGAFRAAECDDVGSPGFASKPIFLSIRRNGATVELRCRVIQGRKYRLEATDSLAAASAWADLGAQVVTGSTLIATDTPGAGTAQRFYRLRESP